MKLVNGTLMWEEIDRYNLCNFVENLIDEKLKKIQEDLFKDLSEKFTDQIYNKVNECIADKSTEINDAFDKVTQELLAKTHKELSKEMKNKILEEWNNIDIKNVRFSIKRK